MKLKKGSAAAKAFMAKIRAKRKKVKKSTIAKPKRAARKVVKAARKKAAKKMTSIHKDTASHNVRISVISGIDIHSNPQAWANAWITAVKHKGVFIDVLKIKDKKYYVPNIRPHVYFSTVSQAKKYISRKAPK
jgi:hypothetical protein